MLNGHVKRDGAAQERYRLVIAAAVELLAAARAHKMMVAYACANHRPDNATSARILRDTDNRLRPLRIDDSESDRPLIVAGTWEAQVIDELAPQASDYLIPKYRWSAFYQTFLDLALRTRGIDTIVIAGGSTDVGVASTAFAARDMDYNTVIASDACTSPERDNHDQMIRRIFPRMARVRTAQQIIEMLARGAGP
jgi:ureidoacrylate peracid hydrolase